MYKIIEIEDIIIPTAINVTIIALMNVKKKSKLLLKLINGGLEKNWVNTLSAITTINADEIPILMSFTYALALVLFFLTISDVL